MVVDRFKRMVREHIDLHYRAAVLGMGSPNEVFDTFSHYCNRYPELLEEAKRELAATPDEIGVPNERCFITKQKRTFLRRAVGAEQKRV